VLQVHLAVAPGATVRPVTSSWERAGFVIATAEDAPAAARHATDAAGLIDVVTVAEPPAGEE
jgi:hypothetical protein